MRRPPRRGSLLALLLACWPLHALATTADAAVHLLPGARHQQASWAKMLPLFLRRDDGDGSR
ncbi:hypothetical protein [Rhodanobacter geophilus]|uniref:Uncharacterized protein n=1 Tax=Rhodanobacter geophilus TaxID=3162488 RepID=A0ABV3QRV5_9GAMM